MVNPYNTPKQVELGGDGGKSLEDANRKARVRLRAIRVFWPVLLYLVTFALYYLSVTDFFDDGGGLFAFYVPCMIACVLIFPVIALVQLGYGIYQIARRNRRDCWLHVYSSLSLFAVLTMFVLYENAGNYATV